MDVWDLVPILVAVVIISMFAGIGLVFYTQGPEVEELATMLDCEQLGERIIDKTTKWHEDRLYDVYKVKCI